MNTFDKYAHCYDKFYAEKDYAAEAAFIDAIIREHSPEAGGLLEFGCGTGRHARLFCQLGYQVTGVDMSADMLRKAAEMSEGDHVNAHFVVGDARTVRLDRKFDAIVALFHVASYMATTEDVSNFFSNARRHVVSGQLFVFDYWNGPAVITQRPSERLKIVRDEHHKIIRQAVPHIDLDRNLVDVEYNITAIDEQNACIDEFSESHRMRYFFQTELEILLEKSGFRLGRCCRWFSPEQPGDESWDAVAVAVAQ